jgi:hypothetical protein
VIGRGEQRSAVKNNQGLKMVRTFRDLVVWNKAMDLVTEIYRLTKPFPKDELFGLTGQLRRAAVSVPANIAEGQGRLSEREFVHSLEMPEAHYPKWRLTF